MMRVERHRAILNELSDNGTAKVTDLARILTVTEETIRRDLTDLSRQGKLMRTHGGAVSVGHDDGRADLPFLRRSRMNQSNKEAIAFAARELIRPGTIISLDPSTTCWYLAKILPNIDLRVVTNSVEICMELAKKSGIEVISPGGHFDAEALAYVGSRAERSLADFNIDQFFFSCRGVDKERGLSEATELHAEYKIRSIELAQESILLADSSKFGLSSGVYFSPLHKVDTLITESTVDAEWSEYIRSTGIDLHLADV
ncbi:DeoR/GlpR family DNA-binding transcription regulator [Calycomorphotria hydatis]|uniref:Glucitol operon repressor n=1 Tax=Calycomorphotria hydatis TaxID=2528027 RepID=A0A517T7B0_9PLAN|nr:DeoR/GlpR family DNA-binding transcription regulator [Calycomorphotria hydatis]QDT64261.1 Glucitol operon repressor [Calycomorphotria hydatis]